MLVVRQYTARPSVPPPDLGPVWKLLAVSLIPSKSFTMEVWPLTELSNVKVVVAAWALPMVAAVVAAIAMAKCFIIDGKILAKFSGNLWLHLLGGGASFGSGPKSGWRSPLSGQRFCHGLSLPSQVFSRPPSYSLA